MLSIFLLAQRILFNKWSHCQIINFHNQSRCFKEKSVKNKFHNFTSTIRTGIVWQLFESFPMSWPSLCHNCICRTSLICMCVGGDILAYFRPNHAPWKLTYYLHLSPVQLNWHGADQNVTYQTKLCFRYIWNMIVINCTIFMLLLMKIFNDKI